MTGDNIKLLIILVVISGFQRASFIRHKCHNLSEYQYERACHFSDKIVGTECAPRQRNYCCVTNGWLVLVGFWLCSGLGLQKVVLFVSYTQPMTLKFSPKVVSYLVRIIPDIIYIQVLYLVLNWNNISDDRWTLLGGGVPQTSAESLKGENHGGAIKRQDSNTMYAALLLNIMSIYYIIPGNRLIHSAVRAGASILGQRLRQRTTCRRGPPPPSARRKRGGRRCTNEPLWQSSRE